MIRLTLDMPKEVFAVLRKGAEQELYETLNERVKEITAIFGTVPDLRLHPRPVAQYRGRVDRLG